MTTPIEAARRIVANPYAGDAVLAVARAYLALVEPTADDHETAHRLAWSYPSGDNSNGDRREFARHIAAALAAKGAQMQAENRTLRNAGVALLDRAEKAESALAEARAAQRREDAERWRHRKRGTTYRVIVSHAELQSSVGLSEGAELVVYQGTDGKYWARPLSEFHDGRFEKTAAAIEGGKP
jgi:hypothetical protein